MYERTQFWLNDVILQANYPDRIDETYSLRKGKSPISRDQDDRTRVWLRALMLTAGSCVVPSGVLYSGLAVCAALDLRSWRKVEDPLVLIEVTCGLDVAYISR
jgi:hypothetical protein